MLIFLALIYLLAPNLAYRLHSRWIPISRETFDVIFYLFIQLFKDEKSAADWTAREVKDYAKHCVFD